MSASLTAKRATVRNRSWSQTASRPALQEIVGWLAGTMKTRWKPGVYQPGHLTSQAW